MRNEDHRGGEYLRRLAAFVRRAYRLEPTGIVPARRGYYGETWRVDTADGRYFLKLDGSAHKDVYERSFPVMEHLRAHGIDFISKVVRAADGRLFTRMDDAVLGIFEWIDGENVETDATKIPEYDMLACVYTVPTDGLSLPCAEFTAGSAEAFFLRWDRLDPAGEVRAILERSRAVLEHRARRACTSPTATRAAT